MQTKSKIVELSGTKYHIRKLPPDVGSFIFMRILGISMRQSAENAEKARPVASKKQEEAEEAAEETKISGEMRVRALSFAVFSGGAVSFADFKLIQQSCMQVVGVVVDRAGTSFPMPIMSDLNDWTKEGEDLASNVGLVMRLTTEVLIFAFADFFEDGGTGF
jgi:hypothetical protein